MENNKTKVEINKVKNRFLPLSEAVALGLEPESKILDFNIIKKLGEGSFGTVDLVTHKKTGGTFAIKSIDKRNKNNQEGKPYFRREIEIMYKVHHPNVVRLFSHFEDDDYCHFVMEYIGKGNLFSVMSKQKSKCFEAKTVAYLMRDLASSVYYLHNMDPPIIHRDIKPENVLLNDDGRLKLTDFGWSNYISDDGARTTYCGTPVYLAPEMIREIGHDSSLDIWCIGVLMFELLTGMIPFPGNNMNALSENILKTKISWPKDINMDAKNLISKILKPDPKDRISIIDMLKHPFFTKNLTNPTEFLFTPSELAEIQNYKPFLIYTDLPIGYNLQAEKEKKKEKLREIKEKEKENISQINQNNNYNNTNNNLTTNPNINSNTKNTYSDLSTNIKDLYDRLKIDYETLMCSYNDLVLSKSEVSKKIEDLSYKEGHFKQEKESLLKELDEKDNEKLNLQKIVAELNQKLLEKETKLKNLNNLLNIFKEKCKKDEDEVEKLNEKLDKINLEKDNEIKDYKETICELEKKLMVDDNLEQHMFSLRQSITGMNQNIVISPNSNFDDSSNDYRKKMEMELRENREFLTNEMDNLRKEMAKEREKYNVIIKNKDDEIKKLNGEKSSIKELEAKKYEKFLIKYETLLKEKEIEVANLKNKNKKMENIIAVNNLRK